MIKTQRLKIGNVVICKNQRTLRQTQGWSLISKLSLIFTNYGTIF